MTENTKIAWCHHTFNAWTGCSKVGPGCDHCYAETWAKRTGTVTWGPSAERRRTTEANWKKVLGWNEKAREAGEMHRVFCGSLMDVWDNKAPQPWRDDLYRMVEETPYLIWMLLSKRIGNAVGMVPREWRGNGLPDNVWLGMTVVNQAELERDLGKLFALKAARYFISHEPGLEPINVRRVRQADGMHMDAANGTAMLDGIDYPTGRKLDLIITGGESGHHARPYDLDWPRDLIKQTRGTGSSVFVKQLGSRWAKEQGAVNGKGEDPEEWPGGLKVREMPEAA